MGKFAPSKNPKTVSNIWYYITAKLDTTDDRIVRNNHREEQCVNFLLCPSMNIVKVIWINEIVNSLPPFHNTKVLDMLQCEVDDTN